MQMDTTFNGALMTRTWFDWRPFGAWVLGQTDTPISPVAKQFNLGARGIFLRLPECKARNSWRWICVRPRRNGNVYSLRWTLPTWKYARARHK